MNRQLNILKETDLMLQKRSDERTLAKFSTTVPKDDYLIVDFIFPYWGKSREDFLSHESNDVDNDNAYRKTLHYNVIFIYLSAGFQRVKCH